MPLNKLFKENFVLIATQYGIVTSLICNDAPFFPECIAVANSECRAARAVPFNREASRSLTLLCAHSDYKGGASSINSLNLPNFVLPDSHMAVLLSESDNCQGAMVVGVLVVLRGGEGSQDNQLKFIDCIYNARDTSAPPTAPYDAPHMLSAFGNLTRYHLCWVCYH